MGRLLNSIAIVLLVLAVIIQGRTVNRINRELDAQMATVEKLLTATQYSLKIDKSQVVINDGQVEVNQQMLDYINVHEYFLPMHHCALQNILVKIGVAPYYPYECEPDFLRIDGYTVPNVGEHVEEEEEEKPATKKADPMLHVERW